MSIVTCSSQGPKQCNGKITFDVNEKTVLENSHVSTFIFLKPLKRF